MRMNLRLRNEKLQVGLYFPSACARSGRTLRSHAAGGGRMQPIPSAGLSRNPGDGRTKTKNVHVLKEKFQKTEQILQSIMTF